MKLRLVFMLFLLCVCNAFGDGVSYHFKREITVQNEAVVFRHVHDWSSKKLPALFLDLNQHDKFFSESNDFAFVEVSDSSGKILFHSPAPCLTSLWISPDSQFFVGLSNIKLYNPYQVVVWRRDGTLIHSEHISESVAKFSAKQRREFAGRYPKAGKFLAKRYFSYGGVTYLDYAILGVPDEISDAAWDYLFRLSAPHPYSDDFSESVTNSIHWFDEKNPKLEITDQGGKRMLSLRSPSGKPISIPLRK